MVYATTTLAAEVLWKIGYDIATGVRGEKGEDVTEQMTAALEKGRKYAKWSSRLAPEIFWLRSTPAQIAIQNPFISDYEAIDAIETELHYDPYNTELILLLALRYRHAGRLDKMRETHERVKRLWPNSPLDQSLTTISTFPQKN